MNEAEIRKYASLMRELDLTGIEIDEKNGVFRLERESGGAERSSILTAETNGVQGAASGMQGYAGVSAASVSGQQTAAASLPYAAAGNPAGADSGLAAGGVLESVTSPTVGIFYAAPAENADPYVKVGDTVHKGAVLCIIEAMKLMNEVVAEKDGVVEAVCVENGQVVEYGTELFRIKELSA